jgi:hypothetical protein
MKRRDFVATSVGASLAPVSEASPAGGATTTGGKPSPQLLELRHYRLRFGPMEARFAEYQKGVLLPALNRLGIKPVGAWSVAVGPDSPSLYLLLPHPNAESMPALALRLAADPEYRRGAEAFRNLPSSDPPYVRRASSLMLAFATTPTVEAPSGPPRRRPESSSCAPTRATTRRRVRRSRVRERGRSGLPPGRSATRCSSAATWPDRASRASPTWWSCRHGRARKAWAAFREDPAWVKLRSTPGYSNAEILTNITNMLLRPTDYSQL